MPFLVQNIRPRAGDSIELGKLTVLVGPNNCGKSQTLKDIREYASTGVLDRLVILESISATLPSEVELRGSVQSRPHETPGHLQISGVKDDLQTQLGFGPQERWFGQQYDPNGNAEAQRREVLRALGTCLIAYLGAEARFKLTAPTAGFDTRSQAPANAIQSLLGAGAETHKELRSAFKSAFKMDIGLDWAGMMKWYLRVAADFGVIPGDREQLDALMKDAPDLEKQGDGYRSFAGIALALLTFPNRLLLLDEPEAFLHPAQARVLGRWLATQAAKRAAQVIVATHSSDFIAGLIASDTPATIIRLNRSDSTRFHQIPSAASQGLVQSPLLSSQPVLDALFHRGVVICEGDPDRAIYQTVAHRFHAENSGEEVLFIHSNGKDAMKGPAELLRQSGTPVCVVADFDILNSEAVLDEVVTALSGFALDEETKALRAGLAGLIEEKDVASSIEELRTSVTEWLKRDETDIRILRRTLVSHARAGSNKWNAAKAKGLGSLNAEDAARASELLTRLEKKGVFVVPCGELESWIDVNRAKGKAWNQEALQLLHRGECPAALRAFIAAILAHLARLPPGAGAGAGYLRPANIESGATHG